MNPENALNTKRGDIESQPPATPVPSDLAPHSSNGQDFIAEFRQLFEEGNLSPGRYGHRGGYSAGDCGVDPFETDPPTPL